MPEARWASFWTAARKHPQLLVSGSGKSAMVALVGERRRGGGTVHRAFEEAAPAAEDRDRPQAREALEGSGALLRASASPTTRACGRERAGPGLGALAGGGQARARRAGGVSGGGAPRRPDPLGSSPRSTTTPAREKALSRPCARPRRLARPLRRADLQEDDARVLSMLFAALGRFRRGGALAAHPPLAAPGAARLPLALRPPPGGGQARPPATSSSRSSTRCGRRSFRATRAPEGALRPGRPRGLDRPRRGLGGRGARHLAALDRAGGPRGAPPRDRPRSAPDAVPGLRAPAREYLYATAEAIEARRQELAHLRQVELPANAEAMRVAKDHGDLSENFEYHAARQRHEYLSARIARSPTSCPARGRSIPARIDTRRSGSGTRVRCATRPRAPSARRRSSALGLAPEEAVYSYQSEFAQSLLGSSPGTGSTSRGSGRDRLDRAVAVRPRRGRGWGPAGSPSPPVVAVPRLPPRRSPARTSCACRSAIPRGGTARSRSCSMRSPIRRRERADAGGAAGAACGRPPSPRRRGAHGHGVAPRRARVLEELARAGRRVSIGLEMYPVHGAAARSTTGAPGKLTEKEFLEAPAGTRTGATTGSTTATSSSSPGTTGCRMFAINTPREVVAAVRKKGFKGLTAGGGRAHPARDRHGQPRPPAPLQGLFGDASFHAGMERRGWKAMFDAQCTWDATMG